MKPAPPECDAKVLTAISRNVRYEERIKERQKESRKEKEKEIRRTNVTHRN
jgi:hypothetical protein